MDDSLNQLRNELLKFIRAKFCNIHNINELSEEIVNEAVLRTCKSSSYATNKLNFGYLSKICYNLAINTYKLRKWEETNVAPLSDEVIQYSTDVRTETMLDGLDKLFIRQSLMTLNETEQIIIYLRYYKDLPFKQISIEINKKISTVLSIHRRALEKLRPGITKYFSEYEEDYLLSQQCSKYYKI